MNALQGEFAHDHDHEDEFAGLYRKDLMLGAAGVLNAGSLPLTRLDEEEVAKVLIGRWRNFEGAFDDARAMESAVPTAEKLLESVSVFRVDDGTDPWELEVGCGAEFVRVRVMRLAPHGGRSETSDKEFEDPPSGFVGNGNPVDPTTVAVVDSGLPLRWQDITVLPPIEEWLSQTDQWLDTDGNYPWEVQAGPGSTGHGLFVSHLISRLARVRVRIAKMGILDPELVTKRDAANLGLSLDNLRTLVLLVDELQVFAAVQRLVNNPPNDHGYAALNLSFAYHDHEGGGLGLAGPAVRAAVSLWRKNYPAAPIFAAAGNVVPGNVVPGAAHDAEHDNSNHQVSLLTGIPGVISVGSQDVVGGPPSDFSDLGYDLLTLGRGAMAISDVTANRTFWSGTSFACAVATAEYVSGRRPLDPTV